MPSLAYCLSLAALLVVPGPTNALLALEGAEGGAWRALRLLPVVLAAYAASVLPLTALGADLLQQDHWLRSAVSLAAAGWVGFMAVALWRTPAVARPLTPQGRVARLFITTLLNPKAFIIGLVLVPAQPARLAALGLFFALLLLAAALWALLGSALQGQRAALMRRLCAGWLGVLALMLGSAALSS